MSWKINHLPLVREGDKTKVFETDTETFFLDQIFLRPILRVFFRDQIVSRLRLTLFLRQILRLWLNTLYLWIQTLYLWFKTIFCQMDDSKHSILWPLWRRLKNCVHCTSLMIVDEPCFVSKSRPQKKKKNFSSFQLSSKPSSIIVSRFWLLAVGLCSSGQ